MTRRTRTAAGTRPAFTLIELLVVVTVLLVIMAILAQGVTIMTNTIRDVKAQGDFVGGERAALEILKRDLQADHFLPEETKPNQGKKLRDQRTDQMLFYDATPTGTSRTWKVGGSYTPPKFGYFWALSDDYNSPSGLNVNELSDSYGFQSTRSGNHFLQFTVVLPATGQPGSTLTADVPFQNAAPSGPTNGYPMTGGCAEVAYFLVPSGTTPSGTKTYKLVRRQRLCARTDDDKQAYSGFLASPPPGNAAVPYADSSEVMSVSPNPGMTTTMLNLADLTVPANRLFQGGAAPRQAISAYRVGEDVLNYTVTSFEVKFTGSNTAGSWPTPFPANTDYPYDTLPGNGSFDTFSAQDSRWTAASANLLNGSPIAAAPTVAGSTMTTPLNAVRITGALIKLRYWNQSTKSTRQTTIAVDL